LVGVGAGADLIYNPQGMRIHNQVIGFAVQFGIPAAMILLGFTTNLLIAGITKARQTHDYLYVFVFLLALVALQVHPTYWARAHYAPILILLGAVMRNPGDTKSKGEEV